MNYEVIHEGPFSTIYLSRREPDGTTVFRTIGEAREALLTWLRSSRDEYNNAIAHTKKVKVSDLQKIASPHL